MRSSNTDVINVEAQTSVVQLGWSFHLEHDGTAQQNDADDVDDVHHDDNAVDHNPSDHTINHNRFFGG